MPEIVPIPTARVRPVSLSSPVRLLARATMSVEPEDTLALAATRLIQNGTDVLPVVQRGKLVGSLTGRGLARALADAAEFSDAVRTYMQEPMTISAYSTGAEALRGFIDGEPLCVIDEDRRLIGVISPADLYPRHRPKLRPPFMAGLPTPLGVHFTAGSVSAGANRGGLVLSGALVGGLVCLAAAFSEIGGYWLHKSGTISQVTSAFVVLAFLLLLALMTRLLPISGVHGAEHKVVNAIERELDLTEDVVRRMPRYHARCGTNYSLSVLIFFALYSIEWTEIDLYKLTLAACVSLAVFRPLSYWVQVNISTKEPNEKQLKQAIDAGEDLLDRYALAKRSFPTPLVWIGNSGIGYVFLGLISVLGAVGLLAYLAGSRLV